MITSRADTLILGWFSTPGVVGIYKLAKTFIEPINMIGTSLYTALYPEISKLVAQKDFQQIRSFRRRVSVTAAGIIVPLCFVVTIAAPILIPFFFSEKFFGAILLTQIMVWQVIWVPFTWLPPFLLAMERAGTVAALNYLDAMIYLILLLALVPFFGASGAAWGTLIRFVVALMIGLAVVAHVEKRMAAPALLESAPTKA
jgi:PST family polysaccharide transporter